MINFKIKKINVIKDKKLFCLGVNIKKYENKG